MKENSRFKFRAWDYESERWVYGYYTKLVEGIRKYDAIVSEDGGSLVRYYIDDIKTLGQYTGLKDLNGKEIYEGDIIKIPETKYHTSFNIDVVFSLGMFKGNSFLCSEDLHEISSECEVIGNIYENPELLGPNNESK